MTLSIYIEGDSINIINQKILYIIYYLISEDVGVIYLFLLDREQALKAVEEALANGINPFI